MTTEAQEATGLNKTELEKVLNTLANLKALKDGAATAGEAEAAAAGIQRLLFKYNLAMADIETKDAKGLKPSDKGYGKNEITIDYDFKNNFQAWRLKLLETVARYNFCMVVHYGYGKRVIIIGKPANVETVVGLNDYITKQIRQLTIKGWRSTYPNYGQLVNTPTETIYKRSFREGAVVGVREALKNQQTQDMEAAGSTGTALVVDTSKELGEAFDEFYGMSQEDKDRVAKAQAERQAAYDAMTPEEKKAFDKLQAKLTKSTRRGRSTRESKVDYDVYQEGRVAGAGVELRKKLEG